MTVTFLEIATNRPLVAAVKRFRLAARRSLHIFAAQRSELDAYPNI